MLKLLFTDHRLKGDRYVVAVFGFKREVSRLKEIQAKQNNKKHVNYYFFKLYFYIPLHSTLLHKMLNITSITIKLHREL